MPEKSNEIIEESCLVQPVAPEQEKREEKVLPLTLNACQMYLESLENKVLSEIFNKFQFTESLFDAEENLIISKNSFLTKPLIEKLIIKIKEIKENNKSDGEDSLFYVCLDNTYLPAKEAVLKRRPKDYQEYATYRANMKLEALFRIGEEEIPVIQIEVKNNINEVINRLKEAKGTDRVNFSEELTEYILEIVNELAEDKNNIAQIAALNDLYDLDEQNVFSHSLKVFKIGYNLAKEIGFSGEDLKTIAKALILHDIGKALIPAEIIQKEGPLDDEEFEIMKLHVFFTYLILSKNQKLSYVTKDSVIPAKHHDKEYSTHKKSYSPFTTHKHLLNEGVLEKVEEIEKDPIVIDAHRILHISDVSEALKSKRSYKGAFGHYDIYNIMRKELDEGFYHPEYFAKFIGMIIKNYYKEELEIHEARNVNEENVGEGEINNNIMSLVDGLIKKPLGEKTKNAFIRKELIKLLTRFKEDKVITKENVGKESKEGNRAKKLDENILRTLETKSDGKEILMSDLTDFFKKDLSEVVLDTLLSDDDSNDDR